MPSLLDSRSGCEPHKDPELIGERGMWRQTRIIARRRNTCILTSILEVTRAKSS